MPVAVTVVKMIGRGVVKVHRQLDQTQTEDAGIEIDIRLRMACDCRHMMNARNVVLHTTYPCAITLMPARLKSLHTSRNLFPKWQIILPRHHIATPIRQHPHTAQMIKACVGLYNFELPDAPAGIPIPNPALGAGYVPSLGAYG